MKQQLEQEIADAAEAERFLSHPKFSQAMTAIRADLFNKFSRTKSGESEERDELWRKMQMADWFESYFVRIVQTGNMAEKTLAQQFKTTVKKVVGIK